MTRSEQNQLKINTYNESSLHHSLKVFYAAMHKGKTEVRGQRYIYDIVTSKKTIIEIQTKNLSKLLPKILDAIKNGYKVILVYPLVITKRIILKDEDEKIISNRKSPVKGNLYDIFKELTGIYPVLLDSSFTLEIIGINMTEERLRTKNNVQSQNKKRRFKRNWIKVNKKLDEILFTKQFCSKKDYLNLLPSDLCNEFCAKDLQNELKIDLQTNTKILIDAHLIIWVFNHMEIIEETRIKNRSHYYRVK